MKKKSSNYYLITPFLSIVIVILMFFNTMSITFDYNKNQNNEIIRFNIFNIEKVNEHLDIIFGLAPPNFAFDMLLYLSYIIIVGLLLNIILFIMKRMKSVILVINYGALIILNSIYIIIGFYINRLIINEEPYGIVSLSPTIWPFLIIIISSVIIYINIKITEKC